MVFLYMKSLEQIEFHCISILMLFIVLFSIQHRAQYHLPFNQMYNLAINASVKGNCQRAVSKNADIPM